MSEKSDARGAGQRHDAAADALWCSGNTDSGCAAGSPAFPAQRMRRPSRWRGVPEFPVEIGKDETQAVVTLIRREHLVLRRIGVKELPGRDGSQ
jgi:hypothetical protein